MTASFPLDFAISLNLGPVLVLVLSLIPGLYFVFTHLIPKYCPLCKRKAAKKADTYK